MHTATLTNPKSTKENTNLCSREAKKRRPRRAHGAAASATAAAPLLAHLIAAQAGTRSPLARTGGKPEGAEAEAVVTGGEEGGEWGAFGRERAVGWKKRGGGGKSSRRRWWRREGKEAARRRPHN